MKPAERSWKRRKGVFRRRGGVRAKIWIEQDHEQPGPQEAAWGGDEQADENLAQPRPAVQSIGELPVQGAISQPHAAVTGGSRAD